MARAHPAHVACAGGSEAALASAPTAASRPRAALSRARTRAGRSSASSSPAPSSPGAASSSATRRSSRRRRALTRSVHCPSPQTTPASRASSSHSATSPGAAPSPRSGAVPSRSTTALRANGSPTGGARQSPSRDSRRAPCDRSRRRHATGRPAASRAAAARSTSSERGTTTAHSHSRVPASAAATTARTASRLSARSSDTGRTTSEPSAAAPLQAPLGCRRQRGRPLAVRPRRRCLQRSLPAPGSARDEHSGGRRRRAAAGQRDERVRAARDQGRDQGRLRLVEVVDAVDDGVGGKLTAGRHGLSRRPLDRGAVQRDQRLELRRSTPVEQIEVAVRAPPTAGPPALAAASAHAEPGSTHASRRSANVAASAAAKWGFATTGPKYVGLGAVALDEAPHQKLAGEAREQGRRRPAASRDQIAGQPGQRDDADVGHASEAPHEEVGHARAHGRRPHDDREPQQRTSALELRDALAHGVFELREATARESPGCASAPPVMVAASVSRGSDGAACGRGATAHRPPPGHRFAAQLSARTSSACCG